MYDRDAAGICIHQFTMFNKPYASVFQDVDQSTESESLGREMMSTLPIAEYALLSDCRSAALAPLIGCTFPGLMGRPSLPGCWTITRDSGPSLQLAPAT